MRRASSPAASAVYVTRATYRLTPTATQRAATSAPTVAQPTRSSAAAWLTLPVHSTSSAASSRCTPPRTTRLRTPLGSANCTHTPSGGGGSSPSAHRGTTTTRTRTPPRSVCSSDSTSACGGRLWRSCAKLALGRKVRSTISPTADSSRRAALAWVSCPVRSSCSRWTHRSMSCSASILHAIASGCGAPSSAMRSCSSPRRSAMRCAVVGSVSVSRSSWNSTSFLESESTPRPYPADLLPRMSSVFSKKASRSSARTSASGRFCSFSSLVRFRTAKICSRRMRIARAAH
mmetsp:Transcript_38493/g.93480  ORF Transcript_38493/g.93480 Transcript_38493/m.93480 type:complete len:289 (-) Transcript_38493:503-1369(-)